MYAVVRMGSHQYLVQPGKKVTVEKVSGEIGSEVRFSDVLFINDGKTISVGKELKASVLGKIVSHDKGPKLRVYKKKRRKGFEKTIGHRQPYTTIEITNIEA